MATSKVATTMTTMTIKLTSVSSPAEWGEGRPSEGMVMRRVAVAERGWGTGPLSVTTMRTAWVLA